METVIALSRDLKNIPESQDSHVHVLLRGSRVLPLPSPKKKFVQSAETKAKFDKMREELESKRYQEMVSNVTRSLDNNSLSTDRLEMRSFRDQMGVALNMLITRVAMLAAGWWAGHRALGPAWGPVVGVALMVVGLAAEVGIYVIKSGQMEQAIQNIQKTEQQQKQTTKTQQQKIAGDDLK